MFQVTLNFKIRMVGRKILFVFFLLKVFYMRLIGKQYAGQGNPP